METQSQKTKLAEAKFRARIASQHLGKSQVFANEPQVFEFRKMLKNRLKEADQEFKELKRRHFGLSPYLEIGAEYAWASALLENKYNASGFACDISPESLANAGHFAKIFKFKKIPKTICCDAYNLPFKSNYFPFVFVFESLHHFPNPQPVLLEIKRILAPGGICLIGREPIKQSFNLNLWRRPTKLRLWEKFLKFLLVLPFISAIGKTETEHGIIETAFSLKSWQRALSIFDEVKSTLQVYPFGWTQKVKKTKKANWIIPSFKIMILLHLLGGGLQAICQKAGNTHFPAEANKILICPNCLINKKQEIVLKESYNHLACTFCGTRYKKYRGVPILLEKNLEAKILSA